MESIPKVDLVGVGLNAIDTLIPLPAFPTPGSKIEYRNASILPGGQVATTIIACRTWGLSTRYVGKLGDDHMAALHHEEFARAGVEARIISVAGAASLQSLILIDPSGERTVLCRRDERLVLEPGDLEREWVVNARVLHVDGHDTQAAALAAEWAHDAGVLVVADLDDAYPGVEKLLANVDYLISSHDFPSRLTDESDLKKALPQIQNRFGCRLTAATLGECGVLAWDGSDFHMRSAYSVPVVDTTGAGDVFHAGFIFGLLQGWKLDRQLDFACAAAALNCMASGSHGGIQDLDTIEALMASGSRYSSEYSDRDSAATPVV